MAEKLHKPAKRNVKRSPNYPSISLDRAMNLIEKLYDAYHRTAVPAKIGLETIGYSIKSSSGKQVLASLSYYGVITREGTKADEKIKISDLGFRILKAPSLSDRQSATRDAALKPAIFKKIYHDHPDSLPQNRLLEWELESTFDFNPNTIPDFIDVFKKTMGFAKIYESDIIEEESKAQEEVEPVESGEKDMKNTTVQLTPSLPLPSITSSGRLEEEREKANYPAGRGVTLRIIATGKGKITLEALEDVIKKLEMDKKYIAEDQPADDESSDS
jgi:hypothetical protein